MCMSVCLFMHMCDQFFLMCLCVFASYCLIKVALVLCVFVYGGCVLVSLWSNQFF